MGVLHRWERWVQSETPALYVLATDPLHLLSQHLKARQAAELLLVRQPRQHVYPPDRLHRLVPVNL